MIGAETCYARPSATARFSQRRWQLMPPIPAVRYKLGNAGIPQPAGATRDQKIARARDETTIEIADRADLMLECNWRPLKLGRGGFGMHAYLCTIWVALLLAFAGCSPSSGLPVLSAKPEISAYRLGPGDRLQIRVLGADELNGQYSVQDDGTVSMLMAGA